MSRKDTYHDLVRSALEAEGWIITHDPYDLEYGEFDLHVDLGAEAPIGAEKEGRKIAVEVKSFLGKSPMTDMERAIGQFRLYRLLILQNEPERQLFLAVPTEAYMSLFNIAPGRDLIESEDMRIIVFNPEEEVIEQWIE